MDQKMKALQSAIALLERAHGRNTVVTLGEKPSEKIDVIPTGSIDLDRIIGVGGLPRGRIIEVYGPESSGKSTIALMAVAMAQKLGGKAVYIDTEHAIDMKWAARLGVKTEDLLFSQPNSGEEALDVLDKMVSTHAIDVVVVDSVAALLPKAEIEGQQNGQTVIGAQATLMSTMLRRLAATIAQSKTVVIFINQIRHKIMSPGAPETTAGGNALKFYASIRIEARAAEYITRGEKIIGRVSSIDVRKNKVAPPFLRGQLKILFEEGFDKYDELLRIGVECGLIAQKDARFSVGDTRLGDGYEAALAALRSNETLARKVAKETRARVINLDGAPAPAGDEAVSGA